MAKKPCCDKSAVKKGQWSLEEDRRLVSYIEQHGLQCGWVALPKKAGLPRCGKSCRLRWLNYLRPGLKRGNYSKHEEDIICNLYSMIGSRWSVMASQLQGRTDNDIKNYWNTQLKYKYQERLKKQLDFSAPLGNKDPESQGKEKQHHGSWKYPYTTTTSSSSSSSSMKTNSGIYNSSLKFRQTEYSLPSLTEYSVDRTPVSPMVSFGYNNDPNSTLFGAESTTSATDSSQSVSLWSHGQDTERDLAAATANSNSEASQGFYYDYDYTYDYGYDYDNGTFVGHAQPLYQESLTCSSPFTVDDSSLLFNIQS